jgi:hypothetical protein
LWLSAIASRIGACAREHQGAEHTGGSVLMSCDFLITAEVEWESSVNPAYKPDSGDHGLEPVGTIMDLFQEVSAEGDANGHDLQD